MSEPNEAKFPVGWDATRVERLIHYYEGMSEEDLVAEDEAGAELPAGQTMITVPEELLPAIRQLLATHRTSA